MSIAPHAVYGQAEVPAEETPAAEAPKADEVKAVTATGKAFATTRVYKTCAAKAGDSSLPTVV